MERNMGYHSLKQYNKMLRFDWLCNISQKQRKLPRFTLCSVALTTAIARVDDLHKLCCDRSTAYVLQYKMLKF